MIIPVAHRWLNTTRWAEMNDLILPLSPVPV